MAFCETFLNKSYSDRELELPNFNLFRKDRQSHGGGIAIYVKTDYLCQQRLDLESDSVESMWLQIKTSKQKPFLMCYVYRPPSSLQEWNETMDTALEKAFN